MALVNSTPQKPRAPCTLSSETQGKELHSTRELAKETRDRMEVVERDAQGQ